MGCKCSKRLSKLQSYLVSLTGLLGIGLGWGLSTFSNRLSSLITNGILLCVGILIPLYILKFPVFGPTTSSTISFKSTFYIFLFSLFYSFAWIELSLFFIGVLDRIIR